MRKLSIIFALIISCFLFACVTHAEGADGIKVLDFPEYFNGICDRKDTAFAETVEKDGFTCVKVTPNVNSTANEPIILDGWSYGSARVDLDEYERMLIVYKYESPKPLKGAVNFNIMKQDTFERATVLESTTPLVEGAWSIIEIDLTPARENRLPDAMPILKQGHLKPFGNVRPSELCADDTVYISHLIMLKDSETELTLHKSFINGYADGSFGAENYMTRAEACAIIARLDNGGDIEVSATAKSAFSDVDSGKWYFKYITHLEEKGYLDSFASPFEPDRRITRAEFAELVYKLGVTESHGKNTSFTDVDESHERAEVIRAAADAGIIGGYDNGDGTYSFLPDNSIRRAEVVRMINNAYGRKPQSEGISAAAWSKFAELSHEHWAFADIIDASFDHISAKDENGGELWLYAFGLPNVPINFSPEFEAGEAFAANAQKTLDERITEIRNTPSEFDVMPEGRVFYVSNNGDDKNTGLGADEAVKTVSKIVEFQEKGRIKAGDTVLFECGGVWRERWTAKEGVTYSAYGAGEKPLFNGNTYGDAADASKWELVPGTDNIWKYKNHIPDIGNIVYNGGEVVPEKLVPSIEGRKLIVNGSVFNAQTSFTENNTFLSEYLILGNTSADVANTQTRLYVRCDEGNPGEVYDSVELVYRGNLIRGASNTVFDNLCLKYSGSHGIGMGNVNNVTVRNCEVGYIGGSAQYYQNGYMVRFGNGIEVYGSCDNFKIDNCYVYQCYDAGITHQYSAGGVDNVSHNNVTFSNNVIEKCIYNIEYFMGAADGNSVSRKMSNILYENNILAYSGTGWGADPTRSASIKGWDHRNEAENFVIKDNIFLLDNKNACDLGTYRPEWMPEFVGNSYVQKYGKTLTKVGAYGAAQYYFDANAAETLENEVGEENAKIYYLP